MSGLRSFPVAVFLSSPTDRCTSSVKLPGLILDTNPAAALQMLSNATDVCGRSMRVDAADLTALEPVGVCLLAGALQRLRRAGKEIVVCHGCPTLQRLLECIDMEISWEGTRSQSVLTARSTLAMCVANQREANAIANNLAAQIAEFTRHVGVWTCHPHARPRSLPA